MKVIKFIYLGIRLDLTILYAFCHVTHNMVNIKQDAGGKKRKYELINKFVDELFVGRKSNCAVETKPCTVKIDWDQYRSELTDAEMASFRCLSRIAFYLPRESFDGLLAGFRWNTDGKPVKSEDDLMLYSDCVAGSVGVLCAHIILYRCDDAKFGSKKISNYIIEKAKKLGRVSGLSSF